MKAVPRVSICIPAYGQPERLRRCLDSILSQSFTDFEVIVSDDTQDGTVREVAESYSGKVRLHYFQNRPSKGTPENWNEAMRKASGNYLMVMHHDDWLYRSDSLAELVRALDGASADMAFARSVNIDEGMNVAWTHDPSRATLRALYRDPRTLFYANQIGAPSAVLFKGRDIYFDARLKWLVDLEFYIRYLGDRAPVYARDAIVAIGLGASQATRSCLGNQEVEIGENLIVYKGLGRRIRHLSSDLRHFSRRFRDFDLTLRDLRSFHPEPIIYAFFALDYWQRRCKAAIKVLLR